MEQVFFLKPPGPVLGTLHNPSLVVLSGQWGSQQHVTDEEAEAQGRVAAGHTAGD